MFEKWFVKKINYTLNFEEILKRLDLIRTFLSQSSH